MQHVATELNEQQRLEALHSLNLLDTEPEPEFDELVRLAAAICGTPISMISLLDSDRLWAKAATGIEVRSVPREIGFCDHTIRQTGLLHVDDLSLDSRFADNPLVAAGPAVRFYAGVPVTDPGGFPVGALCVIDQVPRTLTPEQRNALRVLASQVTARFELRVKLRELEQALARAEAASARFALSEQRFQTFMDSGPFMAYLKDVDGHMLYYNRKVAEHFDVSRTFMINKTDDDLWPRELAQLYRQHDLEVLHTGSLVTSDEPTLNPNGATSTWRSYKFPCTGADGEALLGGISLDVTEELQREAELQRSRSELEMANRQLRQLASVDSLTGLSNRRVLDEQLRLVFQKARRNAKSLSLLILDVDHFKMHNDRFGHTHGDSVLRLLAHCLKEQLRSTDLLARIGGEEFVILLEETDEAGGLALANRLIHAVRGYPWPLAPVTLSIGLSTLGPATPDANRLLTLADEALYAAKSAGRDRIITYSEIYARTLSASRIASTAPKLPTSLEG